jgi:phosphomannomutase
MDIDFTQKKLVAFDLDKTLAKSKSAIEADMANVLDMLAQHVYVCVVSGGKYGQFEVQLLNHLSLEMKGRGNFYIAPTSGGSLYLLNGDPIEIYTKKLEDGLVLELEHLYHEAAEHVGIVLPDKTYGPIMENRVSQVTFSPFGQEAPLEVKADWDTDRKKREAIKSYMLERLAGFDVDILIGGGSSIDIVKKGIDKAYVLDELCKMLSLQKDEVLYIGDAVFPGGNDYAPKEAGYDCINVESIEETKAIIRDIIEAHKRA